MRKISTALRFVTMLLMVVCFLANMSLVFLFVRSHWARVKWSNAILARYCRFGLWVLNVKVAYAGLEHADVGAALYVGNHLSYLDVLVLHARIPACFVTSKEIRETPVLGQICALAGCLFVERRKLMSLRGEVGEIAVGLEKGFNVAIFPEATSGNGEKMAKFKRPLFTAAERARKPVLPFCINYRTVGGSPINKTTRDSVAWYGDMDFAPHLWALCGSGGVDVDVVLLPPLVPGAEGDAGRLAEASQAAIERVFRPIV